MRTTLLVRLSTLLILSVPILASEARATPIVNSFGLASPSSTLTFSELVYPTNTVITTQYAAFGVTLSGHHYRATTGTPFPGITDNYVGVSTTIPFSIFFNAPVTAAAFAYVKNPATVLVEALLGGVVQESFSQAVAFDNPATTYLGFTGLTFDQIRVTAPVAEGLVDNIQRGAAAIVATPVPEPATLSLLGFGLLGLVRVLRRRQTPRLESAIRA